MCLVLVARLTPSQFQICAATAARGGMEAAVAQFKDLVSSEWDSPLLVDLFRCSPPGVAGHCIGLMAGELHQSGGQPGRGARLPGGQALLRPRQSALPHSAVQGNRTHKTTI